MMANDDYDKLKQIIKSLDNETYSLPDDKLDLLYINKSCDAV